MLRPERDKIRLGFHKCLGSRRPMLCPERDKIRLGFHKCLASQEALVAPKTTYNPLRFPRVPRPP